MTRFTLKATVLGTPDPQGLARFYADLFGWQVDHDQPGWVTLKAPGGGPALSFQEESGHVPPVWPAGVGDQQMQVHLDIRVDDLDAAVDAAVALGARLAAVQPQDDVRVCLDPAGHPFCLFVGAAPEDCRSEG